jgi:glutamyl-tRNA synthetase
LRTDGERIELVDRIAGPTVGVVDDVVLRRNDGVPAYNLAVVVDDGEQEVTQVVRGDDLLGSTARQIHLQGLLRYRRPEYAHVPLVVGRDGERLSKRHGAVSIDDLAAVDIDPGRITAWLLGTLGAAAGAAPDPSAAVERFEIEAVPTAAVVADLVPETPDADGGS